MTTTANIIGTDLHSGNYIDRCINHLLVIYNQGTNNKYNNCTTHRVGIHRVKSKDTIILSVNALQVAIIS